MSCVLDFAWRRQLSTSDSSSTRKQPQCLTSFQLSLCATTRELLVILRALRSPAMAKVSAEMDRSVQPQMPMVLKRVCEETSMRIEGKRFL